MRRAAPYGAWPSPVSAADVARAGIRLKDLAVAADGAVWWGEQRPAEGGRVVVVRDGVDVLAPPWNARTRVHEYGGGAWGLVGDLVVFAHWDDQRLYALRPGGEPYPLTPEPERPAALRYADLQAGPGGREVWCVREAHDADGSVRRSLVAVAVDGSLAVRPLVSDGHFLSDPRPSPDGRHLAWVTWDHPRMPWDGTELRVADVAADGTVGAPRTLLGGPAESVQQPRWAGPDRLRAVSDRTGWWNLYELGLDGAPPRPLCPRDEEFGVPQWEFGPSTHAALDDGRLAVLHGVGNLTLALLDPSSGELQEVALPFATVGRVAAGGGRVAVTGAGPDAPPSVAVVDVGTGEHRVLRRAVQELPDRRYLPTPRAEVFRGPDGRDVHALVYPPHNPDVAPPPGERPPYVVFVHGGPTAHVSAGLDLEKVFFTSRGIGVLDVNYGGSTGYGRAYRERLRGQWGVVDVEDCVAAALDLAARGEADAARLAIRGGSAGGWTTLAALTRTDAFAAGTSYYGVAELLRFAQDTHDFESRYLDGLVGELPRDRAVYDERAPLSHVEELSCPVLLLQGLEDEVVPPSQAEMFRDALARKGVPHAYLAFPGEQHGFRRAETVVAALEAELSFYGQVFGFDPPGVPVLGLSPAPPPPR